MPSAANWRIVSLMATSDTSPQPGTTAESVSCIACGGRPCVAQGQTSLCSIALACAWSLDSVFAASVYIHERLLCLSNPLSLQ